MRISIPIRPTSTIVLTALHLEIEPMHYATDPPTYLLAFETADAASRSKRRHFGSMRGAGLALLGVADAAFQGFRVWVFGPRSRSSHWSFSTRRWGSISSTGRIRSSVLLMLALMIRWMGEGHDALAGLMLGVAMRSCAASHCCWSATCCWRRRWRAVALYHCRHCDGCAIDDCYFRTSADPRSFSNGLRTVSDAAPPRRTHQCVARCICLAHVLVFVRCRPRTVQFNSPPVGLGSPTRGARADGQGPRSNRALPPIWIGAHFRSGS